MRAAQPIHFGTSDRSGHLFGWYYPPARGVSLASGVVICNSIGNESLRASRTLRHVAEKLARSGFSVLRFDLDGTGDSAGDEYAANRVGTWLADVDAAVSELRARARVQSVSLVGLRLGATLALTAAAGAETSTVSSPGNPLFRAGPT